ncbi:50S ribosomal protein L11 [Rubrobacter tropicus]|uniref:Large ribosomal subunit protein uL11 n=1 Tax=Rubrobacter tropicus TaxID=2653851 RepID=A0A6G8Q436_9ACTN|nr:50S ribosomal protein L11 [Rubrobacter tropicus]QIN81254.1 50S ribosomal protein L11 [Rubrobacter tropicus]
MGRGRKREIRTVKLELEAGRATPAPPVGRDLGPHGVNLAEFCGRYNEATAGQAGRVVPVLVRIFEDRSFSIVLKTPLTSALLREAAGIEKGSGSPNGRPVGTVSREQLRQIAETKMPDLNAACVEGAMKIVEGTARSMGVKVVG